MLKLFIIIAIVLTACGEAWAQAARVPVGLRMTLNGAEARLGAAVPLPRGQCPASRADRATGGEAMATAVHP